MSSKTPLTDAEEWTAGIGDDDRTVVWSDFARTLELKLAALTAAHAKALEDGRRLEIKCEAATKQVSMIEDFLWGRKYCTELYISPLGFNGGEAWQVELNWGDGATAFQGDSVADALSQAIVAAMTRAATAREAFPATGGKGGAV